MDFASSQVELKLSAKTRYLIIFDANHENLGYQRFFRHFNAPKFKNSLTFISESNPDAFGILCGVLYRALPIIKLIEPASNRELFFLKSSKDDIEIDSMVLILPKTIDTYYIEPCSQEEYEQASTATIFTDIIFPLDQLNGNYFKLHGWSSRTLFLKREYVAYASRDVLKFKTYRTKQVDGKITILDNPAFPVFSDISCFISEMSSLPEITPSLQDSFLQILDEILGWSRKHDPSPFPGTFGLKDTMQMYLYLFEEFELRIKACPSSCPAFNTFEIALKKMTPCIRSIKRQLLKISSNEPAWLVNARQFADATTRESQQNTPKRQKSVPDLPEGIISMPLLVPYLNVEWPDFPKEESSTPFIAARRQFELQLLNAKRLCE